MPACFATGEAAGLAARLAATSCGGAAREVDAGLLREKLLAQGAFIDNGRA